MFISAVLNKSHFSYKYTRLLMDERPFNRTSRRWAIRTFNESPPTFDVESMHFMEIVQHACPTTGRLSSALYSCLQGGSIGMLSLYLSSQ